MNRDDVAAFVYERPPSEAAEVLRRLDPDQAATVLSAGSEEGTAAIVQALDPMRAAGLLARLDSAERSRRLEHLPDPVARELDELLAYPAGTAGSFMDPRVTIFRPDENVAQVMLRLRTLRDRRISDLMIADAEGRLIGLLALQDLIAGDAEATLGSLEVREPLSVQPMTRQEVVVEMLRDHKLSTLAVTDLEGTLIGVLRHDALVKAARNDAIADMQKMVGAAKEERALSSPMFAVKNRLPWLQANLGTAFLAAAVVGLFDATIAKFTALAVLLPVVAGQSGNTGAQALAVTMRGLALREIRTSQWARVLKKEMITGAVNGVAVSLVTATGVYFWSGNVGLTLVIGIAMVVSMIAAATAGVLIPVALTALRKDPATASSIILTTVTDVVGFFTFLGLATLLSDMLAGV